MRNFLFTDHLFQEACESNDFEAVKHILTSSMYNDSLNLTRGLKECIFKNNLNIIKYVFKNNLIHNIDIDELLITSISNNSLDILKYIIENTYVYLDVINNVKNVYYISNANLDVIKYLCENNYLKIYEDNVYLLDCFITKGNLEVIKYLCENTSLKNKKSWNVFLPAVCYSKNLNVVKYMLDKIDIVNSDVLEKCMFSTSEEILSFLIDSNKCKELDERYFRLILIRSASWGWMKLVKSLIQRYDYCIYFDDYEVIKYLCRHNKEDILCFLICEHKIKVTEELKKILKLFPNIERFLLNLELNKKLNNKETIKKCKI